MASPRRSTRIKEIVVQPAKIHAQCPISSKALHRRKQQKKKNAASTKTSRMNSGKAQESAVFLHGDPHTFNAMPLDILYEAWNA